MAQISPGVLVLVFFVYGLAWFVMGLTVALESRRTTALPLASSLKYLAAFGILHSAVPWLDMGLLMGDPGGAAFSWRVVRTLALAISTLALALFGASLISANTGGKRWLKVLPLGLFGVWLLAVVTPHLVWFPALEAQRPTGACFQCHPSATRAFLGLEEPWLGSADILARYLLYLPGSLLAGLAMAGQWRWFRRHSYFREGRDSFVVAGAFFFNALVAGLIVPPGPFFPASVLNYASFFRWVRLPPQAFWALTALVIAFFLVRVLAVFERERGRQLEKAIQERLEAQEETRSQLERWGREMEEKVRERTAEVEARNRELAILQERDRIAREMHDSLGQTLSYLGLRLMAMDQLFSAGHVEKARKALGEMEQAVHSAVADVRESILSLRTTRRPARSLIATLQDYLTLFADLTGLRTEMRVEGVGEPATPPLAQVQLLRVVQEALANVRKHARATQATIAVQVQDQVIEIVVEDDGQGFDLAQVLQERGPRFGLLTMRERAEEIGGTFQIDTAPGRGTRVRVQLPRR